MFKNKTTKEDQNDLVDNFRLIKSIKDSMSVFIKQIDNPRVFLLISGHLREYSGQIDLFFAHLDSFDFVNYKVDVPNFQKELTSCRDNMYKGEFSKHRSEWVFILQEVIQRLLSLCKKEVLLEKYRDMISIAIRLGEEFNNFIREQMHAVMIAKAKGSKKAERRLKEKAERYEEQADSACDILLDVLLSCK